MRTRSFLALTLIPAWVALLAMAVLPAWLPGRRGRRRPHGYGKELDAYRRHLDERTTAIDRTVSELADVVDSLRRRDIDVDDAVTKLTEGEVELDAASEQLAEMLAPEELHALHMEYEANLERAIRGVVTALRGCGITKLPHRPPDDEEPFTYWKRAEHNIVHAQLRMHEVVEVLAAWEPGKPAEVSVTTRLHRA
jgi:hypothetical protein